MFLFSLSPEDSQDVWNFIAPYNPRAADKLEDEFFAAFEILAQHLGMGHTRVGLRDRDVRFWPMGSYLVAYRASLAPLQIIAFLHGARDIPEVIRARSSRTCPSDPR